MPKIEWQTISPNREISRIKLESGAKRIVIRVPREELDALRTIRIQQTHRFLSQLTVANHELWGGRANGNDFPRNDLAEFRLDLVCASAAACQVVLLTVSAEIARENFTNVAMPDPETTNLVSNGHLDLVEK